MKKRIMILMVFSAVSLALARPCPPPPGMMSMGYCCTTFKGEASGGTLIMWDNLGRNARYVDVETIAGESAETAIERLANKIDETNPFHWGGFPTGKNIVTSSGGDLQGILGGCGDYMTAGTETGLGIPLPPHSLTAAYDPNLKILKLEWINPSPDVYDSIRIRFNWSGYSGSGGDGLAGNAESYIRDLTEKPMNMKDLDILVIGVRDDIPSNAAAIHVNNFIQEERYGIPFTAGLAPNWQLWSLDEKGDSIRPQMGIRNELTVAKDRQYNSVKTPQDKPFYQIVNVGEDGGIGGVYRKFIGLTPRHTYKIKARVATLNEPNDNNWSVSLHAAPNRPDGSDLTAEQMAGIEAMPLDDIVKIPDRMALYNSSSATKGRFKEISTENGKWVEQGIRNIALPRDTNSLTVWLKCESSGPMSAAIDWLSLEDLSILEQTLAEPPK
jgi:hypothetical protein